MPRVYNAVTYDHICLEPVLLSEPFGGEQAGEYGHAPQLHREQVLHKQVALLRALREGLNNKLIVLALRAVVRLNVDALEGDVLLRPGLGAEVWQRE